MSAPKRHKGSLLRKHYGRKVRVNVYFTQDEYDALAARSEASGIPISVLLRDAALKLGYFSKPEGQKAAKTRRGAARP